MTPWDFHIADSCADWDESTNFEPTVNRGGSRKRFAEMEAIMEWWHLENTIGLFSG